MLRGGGRGGAEKKKVLPAKLLTSSAGPRLITDLL